MIISHELKLIFIKTKKVGGTSFEIALSEYCGDDCVITPIPPNDEKTRLALGFKGAQNYRNTIWKESGNQTKGEFFNHIPAHIVMKAVPRSIWTDYKTVTIYRNPFDVAISRYYWEGGARSAIRFDEFVFSYRAMLLENSKIAPLKGAAKLDEYLKYENLERDLESSGLGFLWNSFKDIRTKSHLRPKDGASIKDIYKEYPNTIKYIAELCAEEIDYFGYECPAY